MQEQGECQPKQRSLGAWLALLETRHPCEIELGLERIAQVGATLKLACPAKKVVSVAGTNGKGSTVAVMEALLLRQGRRVGAYTSPHLLDYNERVRIDGQRVSDEALCEAFVLIDAACGEISLSYFEFGTLAALLLFQQADLDVALLEVGLGGRLDAVNIVDADVAVITSVALDHESWLGESREQIALEKAGIARSGKPLIYGDSDIPATLLPHVLELGARPYLLGDSGFNYRCRNDALSLHCSDTNGELQTYDKLPLPQVALPSALCAVQALLLLDELNLDSAAVAQVFAKTSLPGRYQELCFHNRNLFLDVAHNPAAAALLATQLETLKSVKIHALFAVMADKDIAGIVAALYQHIAHWHLGELPHIARAEQADDVATLLQSCQGRTSSVSTYADIKGAMVGALAAMQVEDLLLVFGSFFTVAEVLNLVQSGEALLDGEGSDE
ncbi:hypothetical protein A9Q89_06880 [Gammaproteobacteria bacterium 53_120_T64]|nr:hypothetical protein A9Q89_06880 [Gammaproteobacteria bacterium 53_120_T64]